MRISKAVLRFPLAQHAPLQAPPKYLDRFPSIKDEKCKTVAAMMLAMDDAVGSVLAKIKAISWLVEAALLSSEINPQQPE